jgi:hypothetical protein
MEGLAVAVVLQPAQRLLPQVPEILQALAHHRAAMAGRIHLQVLTILLAAAVVLPLLVAITQVILLAMVALELQTVSPVPRSPIAGVEVVGALEPLRVALPELAAQAAVVTVAQQQ